MKSETSRLPARYLAALRDHLKAGSKTSLQAAAELGQQVVALGLETLDLARIHEQTLKTLLAPIESSRRREGSIQRAKFFFAEAIIPIERTHRAALEADVDVDHLKEILRQRTVESVASARQLKRGIVQRQVAEKALKNSEASRGRLLEESNRLQKQLRHLTHEILAAREENRQKVSRQLQDEIAQTLLGINVRLLALKTATMARTGSLKKEINSTQRLVKQCARTIHRFAREFDLPHEG